jgi:hypothetical protein
VHDRAMPDDSGNSSPDPKIDLLRHTVATLAYRGGKALRGAPADFAGFRAGESVRTPVEILAHVGDLLDWALRMSRGEYRWTKAVPAPWDEEVERFFSGLERLDAALAAADERCFAPEEIFRGPIADALNHVGQIAMLRRLAGCPIRGENYYRAEIETGRVGRDQAAPVYEFD